MSKTTITKQEITVPTGALIEVADILIDQEIPHHITETDEDEDTITLEIEYDKEQREAVHAIEDIISDYEEDGQEDENDKE
jgi:hypothetical protein